MEKRADWLELVEGLPDEPSRSDLNELASLPTPHDFFERALLDLCGVDARKGAQTGRMEKPPFGRRVYGFQGTQEIGVRWIEEQDRESSLIPLYAKSRTYGLPGMIIYWEYRWEYASQAGHAAFRHGTLAAHFETSEAEKRFVALWRIVFGKTPLFRPAIEAPPDIPAAPES